MRRISPYYPEKRPAKDSAAAKASAIMLLTGARTLDHITPEWLAHAKNLRVETAERMLSEARARRA